MRPRRWNACDLANSNSIIQIVFRELPGVATVERQLDMHFRDHLLDDELEELPHLIDDASVQLFGITQRDTFYWALPEPVRGRYGRADWEARFDILGEYTRDPNAYWRAFELDVRCEQGGRLHCFEVFGGSWFAPSMASIRERRPPSWIYSLSGGVVASRRDARSNGLSLRQLPTREIGASAQPTANVRSSFEAKRASDPQSRSPVVAIAKVCSSRRSASSPVSS